MRRTHVQIHPGAWGAALALHLSLAAALMRPPELPPMAAGGLQVELASDFASGGGPRGAAVPDPLEPVEPQALPATHAEPTADPPEAAPEAVTPPPPPDPLAAAAPPEAFQGVAPIPQPVPLPEHLAAREPETVEAHAPLPVPPPPAPPRPALPRPAPRRFPLAQGVPAATAPGTPAAGSAAADGGRAGVAPGPAPPPAGTSIAGNAATSPRPLPEPYAAALGRILQRNLRYPASARDQGLEGTAMLRFTIARDGTVRSAQLLRGTGFVLLDHEALALLRRVSPLPRLPAEFPEAQVMTVPVEFVIR
jgi:protein TonB